MAIQYIAKVLAHSKSRLASRLVLITIANYCDENGTAYPSVMTIARDSKITPRQVRRCIADLVALGELSVDEGASLYGTNLYHIQPIPVTVLYEELKEVVLRRSTDKQEGDDNLSGGTNGTQNMSNLSANPLIKPLDSTNLNIKPRQITNDYIATLHGKYDVSHSSAWVNDRMEAAMNHKAFKAAIDKQLYVSRWLARDADKPQYKGERINGNGTRKRTIEAMDASENRWRSNARSR